MRTAWIVLLLALLPLRGWVGDAMALSMLGAGGHAAPAALIADAHRAAVDHTGHAGHPGHGPMTAMAPMADHNGHGNDDAGANAHLLCEVCNGPVLNLSAPALAFTPVEHVRLAERALHFASLAPRQHTKPPIA